MSALPLGADRLSLSMQVLHRIDFVVIGTDRDHRTGALRALLAHNDGSGLNYAGGHSSLLPVRNEITLSMALWLLTIRRVLATWRHCKT
jgi:hypothetical protein